jgi:Indigoidine synthase A like protein
MNISELNLGWEVYTAAERIVRSISHSFIPFVYPFYAAAMDVSADLQELTRCPVGLVSSGVKSILDIGRFMTFLHLLLIVAYLILMTEPLNTL